MNIRYNYGYLRGSIILSTVSFVSVLYYYFFEKGYITGAYNAGKIASASFYISGTISIVMLWIVNFRREFIEKELELQKENNFFFSGFFSKGILRFCSNRYAIAVDISLLVLIANFIIIYALEIKSIWYKDVLKIMIVWFIYIHSILNGRNYIFFKKLYELKSGEGNK